jgi:hypothetical protein
MVEFIFQRMAHVFLDIFLVSSTWNFSQENSICGFQIPIVFVCFIYLNFVIWFISFISQLKKLVEGIVE